MSPPGRQMALLHLTELGPTTSHTCTVQRVPTYTLNNISAINLYNTQINFTNIAMIDAGSGEEEMEEDDAEWKNTLTDSAAASPAAASSGKA